MPLDYTHAGDLNLSSMQSVSASSLKQPQNHVVIMGAGPAGLTAAYELVVHQHVGVTVLEKDPRYVGGISRTVEYNGYRFDIGGHRFFSKSTEIEDLWTEVMGDDLPVRPRLSRIIYRGKYFDYPLKAFNALFNLGLIETVRCITSYIQARIIPNRHPESFEDWVTNQFGKRLFKIFFKTYTEKVWGMSTKELSADWAAQRIKGLNLLETIKNALLPQKAKKDGAVIKTLIDKFHYPRHGPGELWERVAAIIGQRGYPVMMGKEIISIQHDGNQVTGIVTRDANGNMNLERGTHYISTLPMRELVYAFDPPLPPHVPQAADGLKYRDFLTVAMIVNKAEIFPDNWIYLHDPDITAGRIQNFKNWSLDMVPDPSKTCLGLEYFCFEGDGLWTSTDMDLVELGGKELMKLKLCKPEEILGGTVVRQPKAYPVYDDEYKMHVRTIRDYLEAHATNLQLVGRNGMHHYNNQDHSMMTALCAARNIALNANLDPWSVNTDAEYHEGTRDVEDTSGRLVPQRAMAAEK
ncbi:MAG TPA: NAD(P)/FAD-dependent oxidoreductase [Ktedonobacteraceae bacterium]